MPNILGRSPFEILVNLGVVFKSPEDGNGPVVFYDRTYVDANGNIKNYVGFHYYNTAIIEQSPEALEYFSHLLAETIKVNLPPYRHIIAGQQEDSVLITAVVDKLLYSKAFCEKEVLAPADLKHGRKEDSILFFNQQNIQPNGNYIVFEGVYDHSDTTKQMIDSIELNGGNVVAIACIINSSEEKFFCDIPIFSVVHIPTPQYHQDVPEVKKLMEAFNFFSDPKHDWLSLKKEMKPGTKR